MAQNEDGNSNVKKRILWKAEEGEPTMEKCVRVMLVTNKDTEMKNGSCLL